MFVYSVSHTSLACTPPLSLSLFLSYIYLTCVKLCFHKNRGVAVETGRSASVHFYKFTFFRALASLLQDHAVVHGGRTKGAEPCTGSCGGGGRGSSTPPLTGERTQKGFLCLSYLPSLSVSGFFWSCRGFAKPGSS
jgi:hypothetical protein